jgi:NAD(P)-dependent dehydrogenase (short-subunit alcohol dehydrogenase family)
MAREKVLIVIVGASGGIGEYLFNRFTQEGQKVIGTYNRNKPSTRNLNRLVKLDVNNDNELNALLDSIPDDEGKIVLINCAGINYTCLGHKSNMDEWKNVINTNLIGTFNGIRLFLPLMRQRGFGRIINLSSVVAEIGIPGTSSYAASKAGLWGMTRSLAIENASKGITINNINLGYFDIGMIQEVSEKYKEIIKEKLPTRKFGDPKNIYNTVKMIIESDYMNGTSIDLNGGIF